MTYALEYDDNGNFKRVLLNRDDGVLVAFDNRSPLWSDYVNQFGIPPATGTPTWKPARIGRTVAPIITDINALSAADQTKLFNAWRLSSVAQFLIDHPNFALSLGINVAGDQPNT
jgi:hypothetical protein